MAKRPVSLLAFFLIWADRQGWTVPAVHVRVCHWLEHRGDLAVLRCFRGFGKSTLLAIYNAWLFYHARDFRILHQSESDATAYKTSRDTQNILRHHPLTRGLLPDGQGTVEQWWVKGARDMRNASLYARGILSNVTSARADECQNDDIEVPRNIGTPEAREKLRFRLGEQTHILAPGGRKLYIGTPHTHDSLYDEIERLGADCLTIPMFALARRFESPGTQLSLEFLPEYVFLGIGAQARLLQLDTDYRIHGKTLRFAAPPEGLVDVYAGCAWPERFGRAELLKRRRETRTLNEWDSQYQLQSRPIGDTRLDPARMPAYEVEPELIQINGAWTMRLGQARIVGVTMRWDPASGKVNSDVSAVALIFMDEHGRRYWHRAVALRGDLAIYGEDGRTITGGQVWHLTELARAFHVSRIVLETNGIGGFAPAVLKAALKQRGVACGVTEVRAVQNKQRRILEAFEPLLLSGQLWAHTSIHDGPACTEMREFNPLLSQQADDYIDAAAGAIVDAPERIRAHKVEKPTPEDSHNWRSGGVYEVTLDLA